MQEAWPLLCWTANEEDYTVDTLISLKLEHALWPQYSGVSSFQGSKPEFTASEALSYFLLLSFGFCLPHFLGDVLNAGYDVGIPQREHWFQDVYRVQVPHLDDWRHSPDGQVVA